MTNRYVRAAVTIAAVVIAGVMAAALLYGALVAFNAYNPMLSAFLVSFEMYNGSGRDVWVTPIGMWEGSGEYGPLPRFRKIGGGAYPYSKNHDLHLATGETLAYTYDWDDINFRHILVRDARGKVLILDTDKQGGLHVCCAAQQTRYTIPPLSTLSQAPPELVPCTKGRTVRWRIVEYHE